MGLRLKKRLTINCQTENWPYKRKGIKLYIWSLANKTQKFHPICKNLVKAKEKWSENSHYMTKLYGGLELKIVELYEKTYHMSKYYLRLLIK